MSTLTTEQQDLRDKIVALSAALNTPTSSPLQLAAEIMAFGACAHNLKVGS